MKRFVIFISIALTLASCARTVYKGSKLDEVNVLSEQGLDKQKLIKNFGPPNVIDHYAPNTWYYISMVVATSPLLKPNLKEQKILKVKLDKDEKVESFEIINDLPKYEVKVVRDFTRVKETEESSFKHFIKNIGKFGNFGKNKSKKR